MNSVRSRHGRNPVFSAEEFTQMTKMLDRYSRRRSAILPLLHFIQKGHGYISEDSMKEVANLLDITVVEVAEVVSFYTMFSRKRLGKYLIQVCTNISCSLLGAGHIVEYISNKLGIKAGGTTADGRFTLITVECLGSCGTAPVMQINDQYFENLTTEKIDNILAQLG
jgi:NADH-quinone oxidoreductase E subunit